MSEKQEASVFHLAREVQRLTDEYYRAVDCDRTFYSTPEPLQRLLICTDEEAAEIEHAYSHWRMLKAKASEELGVSTDVLRKGRENLLLRLMSAYPPYTTLEFDYGDEKYVLIYTGTNFDISKKRRSDE